MAATRHRLPKPPPAPVHPIVELDYRVRTWANLLVLAVIGSVFLERESPAWYWLHARMALRDSAKATA